MNLEIGKVYNVNHSRKGKFQMRVTGQSDEWAMGVMVQGITKTLLPENERTVGDDVTVRKSFCKFELVQS